MTRLQGAFIPGLLCLGLVLLAAPIVRGADKTKDPKAAATTAKGKKTPSTATDAKDAKTAKPAKEAKAGKDAKDAKGGKDAKAGKDAKEGKDAKGGKDGKGSKAGKEPVEPETVPGHPNLKIRQGSFLRKNEGEPDAIDLRGELERRRDFEMRRHYSRMAELDAIEEVATEENDDALMERVEAVRRKEERRYWAVMQELRGLAWQKIVRGEP